MVNDSHTISCRNSLRQQRKERNALDQRSSSALKRIEESDTIIKMILGNAIPNPTRTEIWEHIWRRKLRKLRSMTLQPDRQKRMQHPPRGHVSLHGETQGTERLQAGGKTSGTSLGKCQEGRTRATCLETSDQEFDERSQRSDDQTKREDGEKLEFGHWPSVARFSSSEN